MKSDLGALPNRMNAAAFLLDRHLEAGRGDKTAIRCDGGDVTYGELSESAARFGAALRDLGMRREERILLACPDNADFIAAFLGAIRGGFVPIPVNTVVSPEEYGHLLRDSRARGLVVHGSLWPKLEPALATASDLENVIVCGPKVGAGVRYEEILDAAPTDRPAADTSRDDTAFWLYSSGTTGQPKGVMHRHEDMVVELEGYGEGVLGLTEEDTTFSAAKLFFAYGLGNGLYFPLGVGGTTILHPGKPTPDEIFRVLADHQPTVFYGVPSLYAGLLDWSSSGENEETARRGLRSARLCVSAGEALPAPLFNAWRERFGLEILDGIGSTEMLHIFLSNRAGEVRPGSTGREVPGYSARIVDDDGNDVPDGEIGNLLVKGASMATGYWNQHERSLETFVGPWCRTGDKYWQDAEGYFWHSGRSDDMLKVKGMWVSPVEVESALLTHPSVLEAAVIGVEDADGLVKPRGFVVCKDGHEATSELAVAIRDLAKSSLAPFKVPDRVEFAPSLPKTATGKIQRFKLREAARP